MHVPAETAPLVRMYVSVRALGLPFFAASNAAEGVFVGQRDGVTPMWAWMCTGAVTLVALLAAAHPDALGLGLPGAAAAITLGQMTTSTWFFARMRAEGLLVWPTRPRDEAADVGLAALRAASGARLGELRGGVHRGGLRADAFSHAERDWMDVPRSRVADGNVRGGDGVGVGAGRGAGRDAKSRWRRFGSSPSSRNPSSPRVTRCCPEKSPRDASRALVSCATRWWRARWRSEARSRAPGR